MDKLALGAYPGLQQYWRGVHDFEMSSSDVTTLALDLPPEERLELARRLVESVVTPGLNTAIQEGIHRIEDILTDKAKGLTEAEFRAALG